MRWGGRRRRGTGAWWDKREVPMTKTDNPVSARTGEGALQQFDPHRVAIEIAAASTAEDVARRAKDPEALFKAVEHKARNQRDFVLWWDGQEKTQGARGTPGPGRGNKTALQNGSAVLENYGLDRVTVHRWRQRFVVADDQEDESKFDEYLHKMQQKCLQIVEAHQAANFSSESIEWYTPQPYLDAVRELYGGTIDLDPASSKLANKAVQAERFFTVKDDGLGQHWWGRVFVNPPYGKVDKDSLAGLFCIKAIEEFSSGRVEECVILVNSVHSQRWQRPLYDHAVCFVDHRISFVSGDGEENKNPTFQNIFVYLGQNVAAFSEVFSPFGYVMRKVGGGE